MENINMALKLMVIGMGTVFVALFLIIYLSKALIWFINRYLPEDTTAKPVAAAAQKTAEIPAKVVAAITTAVNIASGGKAKIDKIEKIK